MRSLRSVRFHLFSILHRSRFDADLELELRDHIERETRANRKRGMPEHEARRSALIAFGGVQRYKEEARNTRALHWLEDAAQDLRYAIRALRHSPGFAIVAVLTLALGVGATSAVFTVVDRVLLRPLPFREPERLYAPSDLPANLPFVLPAGLFDRLYVAYRERQRSFERVVAYQRAQVTLSGVGEATRLPGALVGAEFFTVLGIVPARGRAFLPDEEHAGAERVAIVSDGLWRRRFGGDPNIVGRTITLDGKPRTIVGVAPRGFDFPAFADVWMPLRIRLEPNNTFIFPVIGRLRRGVTVERARTELESIQRSLDPDPRDRGAPNVATISPLKAVVTRQVERSLLVFAGAIAFVLLIAGVNLANLLLIRASSRRHEMALRVSLGASRTRLVRQLLTESAVVAAIGGAIGTAIAFAGVRALVHTAPAGRIPRLDEVHVDGRILALTLALSVITGVIFALYPALASSRRDPQEALVQGPRTIGGVQGRVRRRFVMVEIALAFVLLTAAGLMIRSFIRMRSVATGYDASGVVTMSVDLPSVSYPDAVHVRQFHTGVLERLARIPGVRVVGAAAYRPMSNMGIIGDFKVDGPTPMPNGFSVDKPTAGPGYFSAMGIPLLRGRDFTAHDDAGAPRVVIVSETVARTVWPHGDALGKRISMEDKPKPGDWLMVIGVVKDVVQDATLHPHAAIYLPYLQTPQLFLINHMSYVVRTAPGAAPSIPAAMRAALAEMDPAIPAQALQTMDASMLEMVSEPLFQTRLLTAFSLLALMLAAIGTYGVLAFDVTERTREIGIRVALGAESNQVLRMIAERALLFAAAGIVIGGIAAVAATRVLSRFLFEVSPTDWPTFGAIAGLLACVTLIAGLVPARRASRVDPMVALRHE